MKPYIEIKDNKIHLNFDIQTSPQGRPIRWSGVEKNLQVPEKFTDGLLRSHYFYSFRYMDEQGGYVIFEVDYLGIFCGIIKK
jgi:hypothetical protein